MADPDIPLAYPIPTDPAMVYPVAPPQMKPPLNSSGRSSRIVPMPKQKSKVLGSREINELQQQGFTEGLAKAMTRNNASFPLRIWVVDNSGSMAQNDGHRLVETNKKNNVQIAGCTRWREIQETVNYHSQMASLLQAPTVFRMLNDPGSVNGPQEFSIAERGEAFLDEDLSVALSTMQNSSPRGVTPLAQHVREITENIRELQPSLVQSGSRVVVVLATDGLPTDNKGFCNEQTKNEFRHALRSLEGLPVWVVIRLCTDDDSVVNFYNDLDSQLELSLEVLDDFVEEAKEVNEHNKWLNYALPLHRCREMGYHNRLFDLMDERKLTKDELRDFFFLLFGEDKFDSVPDPHVDWKGFSKAITEILKNEKKQWNPRTKKMEPWINMKLLNKAYGKRGLFR